MADARQKSSKDKGGSNQAIGPDDTECKRLRDRAVSRGNLARAKASPVESLLPSKAILKCNGKDIVKRGHRKNKYLFAFPGLLAPVAGGVLGELAQLDSKNPVMYITFPEGRLKLFGTLVYPKNKYLTLHFSKGAGNIACEDCFENMVVFSECWWIGSKEDNPSEARMDMPEALTKRQSHEGFDFTGGAGRQPELASKAPTEATTSQAAGPVLDEQDEEGTPGPSPSHSEADTGGEGGADEPTTSRRKSSRTAGRSFRFAEPGTDDELDDEDGDSESDHIPIRPSAVRTAAQKQRASAPASKPAKRSQVTINLDSDEEAEEPPTITPAAQSKAPSRSKRKAATGAAAPASSKRKKLQENDEDESAEDSSEGLPSEPSEEPDDSDEEWKL